MKLPLFVLALLTLTNSAYAEVETVGSLEQCKATHKVAACDFTAMGSFCSCGNYEVNFHYDVATPTEEEVRKKRFLSLAVLFVDFRLEVRQRSVAKMRKIRAERKDTCFIHCASTD